MTMGQLCEYKTSLKYYQKGLELFLIELKNATDESKKKELNSSIANAYSTIAELYMNTDLCFEEKAEHMCENYLTEAIKYDKDSQDVLIQYSNLRILRARDNEALEYMERIYNMVIQYLDNGNSDLLQSSIIENLAKNYSELERYTKAIKLYDILVALDDENVYTY
jgi:tetratricopeptide (TPR) repeat protein